MKKKPAVLHEIFWAFLIACLPVFSFSQENVGDIYNFGAGAGALGMGSAYSAVANNSTALYYNPAGLSMLPGRNINMMHAQLFEGASYDYLSYAQSLKKIPGAIGFQLIRMNAGAVKGRDEDNMPASNFSYSETGLAVGTGLRGIFSPFLSTGGSLKILMRSLGKSSDKLVSMDLGATYGPIYNRKINLSLVVQNLGSFSMGDTSDKYSVSYKAGISYKFNSNLLLSADFRNLKNFSLGTEYFLSPAFLRFGYNAYGFSMGGGVKFMKDYQIDLAVSKNADLGMSTRFSMGYYFGGYKTEPAVVKFSVDYLGAAYTALDKNNYVLALENIRTAISMDIKLAETRWQEKANRLEAFINATDLRKSRQNQDYLKNRFEKVQYANMAIKEYIEGNTLRSMVFAHIALGYDKDNSLIRDVVNSLSRLTKITIKEDEILDKDGYVDYKLKKSEVAFYAQKFERVLTECEQILIADPDNSIALTRMGSAYYMLGNKLKAKETYLRAIKVNPKNKAVSDFIKSQGWSQ